MCRGFFLGKVLPYFLRQALVLESPIHSFDETGWPMNFKDLPASVLKPSPHPLLWL